MKYRELLILLPCHSLDDFPTHHEGADAEGLLALWTTLWHPTLIASAGQAPQWKRAEEPPEDSTNTLIAIPNVAKDRIPTGYAQRAKEQGAVLLRNITKREAALTTALAPLGGSNVETELASDFLALGYAFLQVQLLTRQMRYSSNLDEIYFKSQAVEAAQAAVAGNDALARERLSACFSLLAEERDRFYPVEAFIVNVLMTADTTLGASLRTELDRKSNDNILLSGELLERAAEQEPATLALLRQRVAAGNLGIIGGEDVERRLPLLSLDDISRSLQNGGEIYERHLERRPTVFGRRRFGLTPALPQLLHRAGYVGALHATLEDGRFPEGTQLKAVWEGSDGTAIDALARPPLDASQPKTFLQFATKLGESMDADHVATILLAAWPGQSCDFLDDLRRTASYSSCLGRFVTVENYFAETAKPGQLDRFLADRYKSPYLKQAVIRKSPDPISSSVRYWQRRAIWESAQAMHTLAAIVSSSSDSIPPRLASEVLAQAESGPGAELDAAMHRYHREGVTKLAQAVCTAPAKSKGCLVLNPYACVRRTGVDAIELAAHLPPAQKPIYACSDMENRKHAVVDVPGFGFVWFGEQTRAAPPEKKPQLLAEEPNVLRNEFFEAVINPTTGALQTLHEYSSRRNRVSQQLGLRTPGVPGKPGDVYRDPNETAVYSVMAADSINVTCSTTAMGEITVVGRLLDLNGKVQATFREVFRVWRGSRVLQLEITLDPQEELRADPWNNYYACRFAWGVEACDLARTVHQQQHVTAAGYLESPHYIEIESEEKRTAILTGGLPFHRRSGPAVMDSLLVVRGETARTFKLGIGIDLPHPLHEAMALLAPPVKVETLNTEPPGDNSGWLLHLDCRNVVTTHLEPIVDDDQLVGYRVQLLETAGRAVNLTLTAFRAVRSACTIDLQGRTLQDCTVEGGKVKLEMSGHGWTELEAFW